MRLRYVLIVAIAGWAFLVGVVFARRPAGEPAVHRQLSASVNAADIATFDLAIRDGDVDVKTAENPAADTVEVRLAVDTGFDNLWFKKMPAHVQDVTLESTRDGDHLHFALEHGSVEGAETTWTIVAPARLAARIDVAHGRVSVHGLAGGLTISVDSGSRWRNGGIDVDVPGGPLDLTMGVGTIRARTAAKSFGSVDVRSSVGAARLFIDGENIEAPSEAGPGSRIRMHGGSDAPLKARVSVGDATIRIR